MATRKVFRVASTFTASTQIELDPVDLSWADIIRMSVRMTENATGTSPTMNVYLQSRFENGLWNDRIASAQFGFGGIGEAQDFALQKFGTLSDTEEAGEPSGSAGAGRLAATTVRNGPFPGVYRSNVSGPWPQSQTAGASWRLDIVIGGTIPSFPVEIMIFADSAGSL